MSRFLEGLLGLSPVWILLLVGLLVFAEDALFVGFVIPGETAAVLVGVAASFGTVQLWAALVVVVAAAIVGDTVGYEVGKHFFGPKVMDGRFLRGHRHRFEKAEDFLQRRGGSAVFLGRFTAFFRAMMPALAGAARMPYRRFVVWNATGGLIWGTVFVVLGYLAGSSYHTIEQRVGRGMALAVAAVVIIAAIVWKLRSRRREKLEEREYAVDAPSGGGAPGRGPQD